MPKNYSQCAWYHFLTKESQTAILKDTILEAGGFDVDSTQRYETVSRVIKKVHYHLRHVAGTWNAVLAPHVYLMAMGKLVDRICVEICGEILRLSDIAEMESERLAELLTFREVESLFLVQSVSYTAHYCGPNYLKFKTLIQVLTWSFSSIMEHFRMGALTDFSIHELVHLCKALFSDTPLRQKNIAEIQQGHPM
jgi:hypothetical protein